MGSLSRIFALMERLVVVTLMIAASGVLFVNVLLRYFFGSGFSWAEEFIIYAMVWIAFIGSSICVRKRCHVAMRLIVDRVNHAKFHRLYELLLVFVTVIFSVIIIGLSIRHIQFLIVTGQTSPALQLPMYIPYLAIPLGFALMTLRLFEELWSIARPELRLRQE